MMKDKPSLTSCKERDAIDANTKPGYIPGVNGLVVYAALDQLALEPGDCDLVIEKRKSENGKYHLKIKFKKI